MLVDSVEISVSCDTVELASSAGNVDGLSAGIDVVSTLGCELESYIVEV